MVAVFTDGKFEFLIVRCSIRPMRRASGRDLPHPASRRLFVALEARQP